MVLWSWVGRVVFKKIIFCAVVLWSSVRRVPIFSKSLPSRLRTVLWSWVGRVALEKIIFHAMVLWSYFKRLPMKMQSDSLAPFVEGVPMLGFKYFCCIKVMLLSGPLWKKWRSKILQNWVDSCRFTLQRCRHLQSFGGGSARENFAHRIFMMEVLHVLQTLLGYH